MTLYFVVFASLATLSLLSELTNSSKISRYLGLTSGLIIVIFFGFRWETGTDWESYKQLFDDLADIANITYYQERAFETGFLMTTNFIARLTTSLIAYNIIFTLTSFSFLYFAFRRLVKNISLSFLSVYSSFGLINFMGSIRRGLAISLVMLAISLTFATSKSLQSPIQIWPNKSIRIKQALYLFIASLFHRSAIASLFVVLIPSQSSIKASRLIIFFVLICLTGFYFSQLLYELIPLLASIIGNNPVANKLLFYTEFGYIAEGYDPKLYLILSTTKRFLLICVAAYSLSRLSSQKSSVDCSATIYKIKYFLLVYCLGFFGYVFFSVIPTFQIMTVPYAMSECFLLPLLLIPFKKTHRIFCLVLMILYLGVQLGSSISVLPDAFLPYKSILF